MYIFYDGASGEINSLWPDPPESKIDEKTALGLAVIEAPWPDDEAEKTDYLVLGGKLTERPAPTAAEILEAQRSRAVGELIQTTQHFIRCKPDGRIRYDNDLKLNLLWAAVEADKAGKARPGATGAVALWINRVQAEYGKKLKALQAAVSLAEVKAVDISYPWFEERFGVNGNDYPDPDKSTQDLRALDDDDK